MEAAMAGPTDGVNRLTKDTSKDQVNEFKGLTTGPAEVPHCGCDVLHWDDCQHTIKP